MLSAAPTLSVMIPAYGRTREFEALLRALIAEPAVADRTVPVIVSDDRCPYGSAEIVRALQREYPDVDLRLQVQAQNLGMIANTRWCHEHCETDYVWIFGNDDRPLPGMLAVVLQALADYRPALLHLPHNHARSREEAWGRSLVPADTEVFPSSRELALKYGYWLSLMSASVVRCESVQRAIEEVPGENEWCDFLWYLVGARDGRCVVIPHRVLENGFAPPTWDDKKQAIYTTEFVRLFDDGLSMVFDEAEFGRLIDNRYDSIGADVWTLDQLEQLTAAVKHFPSSRHMRVRLAEFGRAERDATAIATVAAAATASGDDRLAADLVAEAERLFAAGDRNGALERSRFAALLDPTNVTAWCDAGVISEALGDEFAPTFFDEARRTAPDDPDVLLNLASWEYKRGLYASATLNLRQLLELAPQSHDAQALLRRIEARTEGAAPRSPAQGPAPAPAAPSRAGDPRLQSMAIAQEYPDTPDLEAEFFRIEQTIRPFTMAPITRSYAMWNATRNLARNGIPGAIVECGVWRGGQMMTAALALYEGGDTDRDLYLFDTFAGMPAVTERDYAERTGERISSSPDYVARRRDSHLFGYAEQTHVQRAMDSTGYPRERIKLVPGLVEDTLPGSAPEQIALLRLNLILYTPWKHALSQLWDRIVPGGVLLLDDYGFWAGARDATDEFFAGRDDAPLLNRIDRSGRLAVKL